MTNEPTDTDDAAGSPPPAPNRELEEPRRWLALFGFFLVCLVVIGMAVFFTYTWPLTIGVVVAVGWTQLKVLDGAKVPIVIGAVAILAISVAVQVVWLLR